MYVASAYDNDQFVKRQINNKVTVLEDVLHTYE